ncbi:hypothetical protein NDU88_003884 [Pleurodeles waltl]|uniref:Uncharacterized protein n=1 Tax=Pleurodeles waltl TaxID=8319 RepID=A0AAV7RHI6_PLEWA|nr:hypothetical protein NDU88_003884 [Pleurodeles waltl]
MEGGAGCCTYSTMQRSPHELQSKGRSMVKSVKTARNVRGKRPIISDKMANIDFGARGPHQTDNSPASGSSLVFSMTLPIPISQNLCHGYSATYEVECTRSAIGKQGEYDSGNLDNADSSRQELTQSEKKPA